MSASFRMATAAIVLTALAALAWVSRTIQGQIDAFQSVSAAFAKASLGPPPDPGTVFATPERPPLQPVPTVHLMPTPTAGAARAWAKLREPIPFQFPGDTTFGEVLKYIRKATRGPGDSGLNLFFEPSESPNPEILGSLVNIELEGVPLADSLTLLLRPLGLVYRVDREGVVIIEPPSGDAESTDPEALMLDNLAKLRTEVAALRWEVAAMRAGGKVALVPPGTCAIGAAGFQGAAGSGMGAWSATSGLQSRPVAP